MTLEVTREAIEAMLQEAALASPEEVCGLLLGGDRIEQAAAARNVAAEPERRFEIDPQALIDAHRSERGGGPGLRGYYHSHPNGVQEPSATDRDLSNGDGKVWAIVANGMVRFFRDEPDGFAPLSYVLVEA
jgi:proteasome lid subunit RPN8/RPN11